MGLVGFPHHAMVKMFLVNVRHRLVIWSEFGVVSQCDCGFKPPRNGEFTESPSDIYGLGDGIRLKSLIASSFIFLENMLMMSYFSQICFFGIRNFGMGHMGYFLIFFSVR